MVHKVLTQGMWRLEAEECQAARRNLGPTRAISLRFLSILHSFAAALASCLSSIGAERVEQVRPSQARQSFIKQTEPISQSSISPMAMLKGLDGRWLSV